LPASRRFSYCHRASGLRGHGRLIDIAAFEQPSMFTAFGLPASL
jgi:hypothetical protein